MMNDSAAILDDLLSRWFDYTQQYRMTRGYGGQPMFRYTQRPRGGQTVEALMDDETEQGQMEAIDHHVSELPEEFVAGVWVRPYRSAILAEARNCHSGKVWSSPRLPEDWEARSKIVLAARTMLTDRLMNAGVM